MSCGGGQQQRSRQKTCGRYTSTSFERRELNIPPFIIRSLSSVTSTQYFISEVAANKPAVRHGTTILCVSTGYSMCLAPRGPGQIG